jgi:hypothetical protein
MRKSELINAALAVAKTYPVFPTNDKRPVWSNLELDVGRGQGGYKIATQDRERVVELFHHTRASEIAVPMGAMSGLICVDVDLYKDPSLQDWIDDNSDYLMGTLCHKTRSGGLHFIFKHPGDVGRLPATLREGVDLKANGTGYICWPPTEGYEQVGKFQGLADFPMELVTGALKAKGGTGSLAGGNSFNEASDADLIERVREATELYPSLRSLSFRLASRRKPDGEDYTQHDIVEVLTGIMQESVAADVGHPRHEDWLDREEKIPELAASALEANELPVISAEEAKIWMEGEAFMDTQKLIAASVRPTGPQRETTASDIEERVADIATTDMTTPTKSSNESSASEKASAEDDGYIGLNATELRGNTIDKLNWIVPLMIPEGAIVSLAGASNVGKTRWLAALTMAMAAGDTARMGLPQIDGPVSTLWLANEERVLDIARRVKAVTLQHDDKESADIIVRGKDKGMMRLVALNEIGNPEIDEKNVAEIVAKVRENNCKLVVFDPYVTLSDAMDENSAVSAASITKAMLLISTMTGAAVMHAHHTPKDRSKDVDWIRGTPDGWRGSSAIYSALDCGFTLANWMPRKDPGRRKAWKENYLDANLSRFIVLDTGKIREGEALEPVMYELVGQEMDENEGAPIGVCRRADEAQAYNALLGVSSEMILAGELAYEISRVMGVGTYTKMNDVHKQMEGIPNWPDISTAKGKKDLLALWDKPVYAEGFTVQMVDTGKTTTGKWQIIIKEDEDNG